MGVSDAVSGNFLHGAVSGAMRTGACVAHAWMQHELRKRLYTLLMLGRPL